MHAEPLTINCTSIFAAREHICFGISPFNSYFSEAKIEELARWGQYHFRSMHFFMPDAASAFTLEALGYASDKACWKARRQGQYLYNKIHKVLVRLGYAAGAADSLILNGHALTKNTTYQKSYIEIQDHFNSNANFRSLCLEASHWVLEKRTPPGFVVDEGVLLSAARYLLAEFPLFLNTVGILGKENSVFCYHQRVPFLENLYARKYSLKPQNGQGFLIATSSVDSFRARSPEANATENPSPPTAFIS